MPLLIKCSSPFTAPHHPHLRAPPHVCCHVCRVHARPCLSTGWALNRRFDLTFGTMLAQGVGGYVQLQHIVVALCNYKNDRASIGSFNIFDVTHQEGEVVNLKVNEMQGITAMVRARYMPIELPQAAQVLHWPERMLMTKYNILATRAHMVKPEVHNLWQLTTEPAEALAQWLVDMDLPKSVPSIPYEAPSRLPSCPALEVDTRQSA